MKLITIILMITLMQVSAASFGQKLTLKKNNVTLEKVFREIRKQTGYDVLISTTKFKTSQKINANFVNSPLDQVMQSLVKGTELTYTIEENAVVIKEKEKSFLENIIARFQAIDVRGKVVDEKGEALPGATVKVKGSGKIVLTDAKGEFYISNVKEDEVLVITYTGYLMKEVNANGDLSSIQLELSNSKLDEIQIMAYGTTSQRLNTGNIVSVKAADIEKQPVNNPLLALAGRVPGLEISQGSGYAGSAIKVRIQGTNSINEGANEPFYVIDGVPYPSSMLPNLGLILGNSSNSAAIGNGNPLSYINPQDIESIEILKDASATAIYGSRAANGAILITTKKGTLGPTKVNVNIQSGFGRVARKLDLLNTEQYLEVRKEAYKNTNTVPTAAIYDLKVWDQKRFTDWQKVLIGNTAKYNDAQVSFSGGNTNVQYLVSGNYHKETTVFPGDKNDQKGSTHFTLNSLSQNQKFRLMFSGSYMMDNNNLANKDLTPDAMTTAPNAPDFFDLNGNVNWEPYYILFGTSISSLGNNPIAQYTRLYRNKTSNLIGNANLSYEILTGLVLKSNFGYNKLQTDEIVTNPSTTVDPTQRATFERTASYGDNEINSWIMEPQLTYSKSFGKGKLEALLGASIQQNNSNGTRFDGKNYKNDLVLENINAAQTITTPSGGTIISEYKYSALFGRINYNIQDKYIIELTARRDGTSRFGRANQFHNFGALSGAWIFSGENIVKNNLLFLSFGKLRASYGTTGSDQIGDYRFLSLYRDNNIAIPYAGTNGLEPEGLPNPFLQWEETRKLSIGLDLGFLKDRILLNTTYFRNRTSNQLLFYTLPPSTGFSGISANFPATVQNTGIELLLNTTNIRCKNFSWTSNLNLTIPNNKLLSFPNLDQSSYAKDLTIGKPISLSPRLYKYIGVDPATGIYQYLDKNGNLTSRPDATPDNDFVRINAAQMLYGGLQNSFTYKNLSLDVLFSFVKQNGANYFYGPIGRVGTDPNVNSPASVLDRWQKPGDIKSIGQYSRNINVITPSATLLQSDAIWNDASYIRLKNLSLYWKVPEVWIKETHLQNARLYVQGQNLFTITNYIGLDPETRSSLSLPPLRVITFGIQLTL